MGKKRSSDDGVHLPQGDLIQILVWLPVVSLLRFKSVCRSWYYIIENSTFIDLHTANTFNSSSSSSSNNRFGSFILLATVERRCSPKAVASCKHLKEYALLMLSTESVSRSVSRSVSKSGSSTGWWWSTDASNYITDASNFKNYALKEGEEEEEELPDYDDQVFTVDNYYYNNTNDDEDDEQQQQVFKLESLGFPPCFKFRDNYSFTEIVGSCNGIVCLYDRDEHKDVSLWNPATRQFRRLPKSITVDDTCRNRLVAFGFDVQTKDYKVLLLTCFNPRHYRPVAPVECLCRVQVYSLRTNSWRLLEGINCLPGFPQFNSMAGYVLYLNGSCFFIAKFFFSKRRRCFTQNNRFIISFDFTKEIFTPIQLPYHHRDQDLYLSSLGDKIAIFTGARYAKDVNNNDILLRHQDYMYYDGMSQIFDIWVLNEHISSSSNICSVNKESWTKLYSFRIEPERSAERIIPRGISNDGEFALLETKFSNGVVKQMKLYNLVTKEVKKKFLSCSNVTSKANAYKPSLVDLWREWEVTKPMPTNQAW